MLDLHEWGPGRTNLLYSGIGFYAVGQQDAPTVQTVLSPGQKVSNAQWLTDDSFIVSVGFPESNTWELSSANNSGERLLLTTLHGFDVPFAVWRP